jgi:hypothetical protein
VDEAVDVRFSDDEGKTRSELYRLLAPNVDGYPGSVQRPAGQVVTAFCGSGTPVWSNRRAITVVIWDPS